MAVAPAREAVPRPAAVGLLFGPQRATADGTVELQPLLHWFVGLEIDEPVWNHAVFCKCRDRLLNQELAQQFFVRGKT